MVEIKHLKKGDSLLKEGDHSNAMYWVQSGTLRLFKKKGAGFIELGVVHSGEVVGEMSFLDNLPRSASVEALQPCDVVEIPRGKFEEFINVQPSWMKSLIHTLVKRLRSTNNRLRELESYTTTFTKDDSGRSVRVHEFMPVQEILRLSSSLLLAHARNSEKNPEGATKVKAGWLQFYGSQIFGVQLAKIQVFTDLLQEAGVLRIDKQKDFVDLYLLNVELLEKFVYWMHEENSKVDDKQLPITKKGMEILNAIHKFGGVDKLPTGTEKHLIDMEAIFQQSATEKNTKLPFELSSYPELVKAGFSTEVKASGEKKEAEIHVQRFVKLYPLLALRQRFRELNEQKSGSK